jgi:aryl-alcohol dehydrogenase-like predicted oxidoreductase
MSPRFTAEPASTTWAGDFGENGRRPGRATPAQVALAWLLRAETVGRAHSGTTKLYRLERNLGAAGLELKEDLRQIEEGSEDLIEGERLRRRC